SLLSEGLGFDTHDPLRQEASTATAPQLPRQRLRSIELARSVVVLNQYCSEDPLKILFQHGVIPGPCHTKARGISSPGIDEGPPHGALQSWRAAMEHYVGLDVSLKLTAVCIVDQTGRIEREGVVASNPEAIAAFIKSNAPHVTLPHPSVSEGRKPNLLPGANPFASCWHHV